MLVQELFIQLDLWDFFQGLLRGVINVMFYLRFTCVRMCVLPCLQSLYRSTITTTSVKKCNAAEIIIKLASAGTQCGTGDIIASCIIK